MTTAAVVSIHSQHADKIYNGEKRFEFRTRKPARSIDYLALYETLPVRSVTGFAHVSSILEGSPREVWEMTQHGAGITYNYYMNYFKNKKKAVAYCLSDPCRLQTELSLQEIGVKAAPQSFQYLSNEALGKLLSEWTPDSVGRLFIGGVHGVGKTAFAKWLAEKLNCDVYSSSELIADWQKGVSRALEDSQDDLISALKGTSWFRRGGILDGHFVLRDSDGSFFCVPETVFSQMELSSILLLTADPAEIAKRLISRDFLQVEDLERFVDAVGALQAAECERAKQVARAVGVPMDQAETVLR